MTYVDGYLTPVRREMREAFVELSRAMAAVYREHGALRVVDCWQDETPQDPADFHAEGARDSLGEQPARDLHAAAGAGDGEVVVLSWTEWPDKATRDRGLAAVLADPRVQPVPGAPAVFEGRRLVAGGFDVVLDV
ncbi:DUF1428 domain-containing protein [Blastococcus sp. SYSU D00820]